MLGLLFLISAPPFSSPSSPDLNFISAGFFFFFPKPRPMIALNPLANFRALIVLVNFCFHFLSSSGELGERRGAGAGAEIGAGVGAGTSVIFSFSTSGFGAGGGTGNGGGIGNPGVPTASLTLTSQTLPSPFSTQNIPSLFAKTPPGPSFNPASTFFSNDHIPAKSGLTFSKQLLAHTFKPAQQGQESLSSGDEICLKASCNGINHLWSVAISQVNQTFTLEVFIRFSGVTFLRFVFSCFFDCSSSSFSEASSTQSFSSSSEVTGQNCELKPGNKVLKLLVTLPFKFKQQGQSLTPLKSSLNSE